MIRIGMTRQGSFPHPLLDADHWLSEHVLYKITKFAPGMPYPENLGHPR